MKNNRDLGLTGDSHGAGKGDACRTRDTRTFRSNFDQIKWEKKAPGEPTYEDDERTRAEHGVY